GAFFAATLGTNAASNWNSPSIISLGFISLAFAIASTTRSVSSDWADPLVEKLSIATFVSIPKTFAVLLLSTAISAKSSLVGAILIAQSPKTYRSSPRIIINTPDVLLIPGSVFMICNAGLTVSDVE